MYKACTRLKRTKKIQVSCLIFLGQTKATLPPLKKKVKLNRCYHNISVQSLTSLTLRVTKKTPLKASATEGLPSKRTLIITKDYDLFM